MLNVPKVCMFLSFCLRTTVLFSFCAKCFSFAKTLVIGIIHNTGTENSNHANRLVVLCRVIHLCMETNRRDTQELFF